MASVEVEKQPGILGAAFQARDWIFQMIKDARVENAVDRPVALGVIDIPDREVGIFESDDGPKNLGPLDSVRSPLNAIDGGAHLRELERRRSLATTEIEKG